MGARCAAGDSLLAIAFVAVLAHPAGAQTTATYHLHNEASTTAGRLQLAPAGPDHRAVRIRTPNLRNEPPGTVTIRTFDTPSGVPNRGGLIPAHATVTFTLWMWKTSAAGVVFPQATLSLDSPAAPTLCSATGGTALTAAMRVWTFSCTTGPAPIAMSTSDRLVVTVGYSMTAGPGAANMRVVLGLEGRLDGRADSRVVAPNPVPPAVPLLAITAPPSGTVVAPGDNLMVTVTSPAGVPFDAVGLVGGGPIGIIDLGTALPAQTAIPIPSEIACRRYTLTASGRTVSGLDASATVLIDVERADPPLSLEPMLPQIRFEAPGPAFPVKLLARFADLALLDVTESTRVRYASSSPDVATVEENGVVTAVAPGTASVTATYGEPGDDIRARIPVFVPSPVFTVSPASLDFGARAVGSSSVQEMTLTNTSRAPLAIFGVAANGDFVAADDCVASSPLPVGADCTLTVTFRPTATGLRTGTVGIVNGFYTVPVAFGLAGTGVAP